MASQYPELKMITLDDGFALSFQERLILRHTRHAPCLWMGTGTADIEMFRGNFSIKDRLDEKIALTDVNVMLQPSGWTLHFSRGDTAHAILDISRDDDGCLSLKLHNEHPGHNRIWLRLAAMPADHIYGCGEQFSYFDLRGKPFPLWTSEQGVGRNKSSYVTWQADCKENAGGDYYWTFFPQPTFVSSQKYYCHVENSGYMNFDFSDADFHELAFWEDNATLRIECAATYISLLEKLTARLGRQPELPDWVYDGVTLGVQGGTDVCQHKLDTLRQGGVKVNGLWAQDWSGIRMTSFGKRVMWNWEWNSELYPQLDERIAQWKQEGVQFLSYINPYLASDKALCEEAARRGYLTKDAQGKDYHVEFGEFYAGVIDLTNPEAYDWYKALIKKNLIDLGCSGWMADFGEYLPTDTFLHNGVSAEIMHNAWPALWAKCNYQALEETGKLGEALFFMRAGYTGSQKYSLMMWAGDQNVDWSLDDGLASVIPAALSLAMSGHGLHHSDIGGYTTLFEMKRSKELLLRWCDFSAFTPMMRTHEGNRPGDNWQFDSDAETIAHFARMTTVFTTLKPYIKQAVAQNAQRGLPVMRPLFLHYENDAHTYDLKYQYLFGRDLLVAPVYEQGRSDWTLYLPQDAWINAWTGESHSGGENVTVAAPLGQPPVFYRANSEWQPLFASLRQIAVQ
ncbi:alpha-glucosidase [Scandinavium sp. V105_16]|uniref:Alpha-glucosidase n=1 Tax=Scandinavium lactucae TaxID=3095028 RepID=A0AAJ2VTR1_9ENTR|nr:MULTISPECIES: alpha-glucosidase [unclassified Scandinavium]MDX6021355.1 alpha-glucosidase [Scandinavium sp. V105_16]MDX6033145.1 alpha-glucosidase [Scandinavium sp. V105_12]